MSICHACITVVMHVPDMSICMSCRCVMYSCHDGDISLGLCIYHAGMSWGYVMNICHACTRYVMHVPDMSLGMSCMCVMVICHGDMS